jgi:molybdenum cofactor cytidylyltransferase
MTGLVILAAGESSRMGQPKQNLIFKDNTLLENAVKTGLQTTCRPVIVVIGANADKITRALHVTTLYNKDWKEGIASSIGKAMVEITNNLSVDSVIIMLCDQPFVSTALLNSLISKQTETEKPIVACAYKDAMGVPVLFGRTFFAELLILQGQEGAKTILKNHPDDIVLIPFEQGNIDIDTPEDYERLRNLSD